MYRSRLVRSARNFATLNVRKSVLVSKSKNVHANLALEDWLYKNFDFVRHHVLLLWQNDPCVVLGRHQNPFVEADLDRLARDGIALARRNSGGGTVYHDNGNLNLTFYTTRECYDRKYNLEIIRETLSNEYKIGVEVNEREDLVIDDRKVSGTASKLGRPNAYHHCTLLVDADIGNLSRALRKADLNIQTNATKSKRSNILNLCDANAKITIDDLIKSLGIHYMRTPAFRGKNNVETCRNIPLGFEYVDPNDDRRYPGVREIRQDLMSDNWILGKTPKFTVEFTVHLDANEYRIGFVVDEGLVKEVKSSALEDNAEIVRRVKDLLEDTYFTLDSIESTKDILKKHLKRENEILC